MNRWRGANIIPPARMTSKNIKIINLPEFFWIKIRKLNKLMVIGFSVVRDPERKAKQSVKRLAYPYPLIAKGR